MRAFLLLLNIALFALAWYLGSFWGLLVAAGLCFALMGACFVISRAHTEARESKQMQRAFGRSTTFLAGLRRH